MKLLLIVWLMMLSGCAQLMHGEQQAVVEKGNGEYFTSCSGAVEEWSSCNMKARKACHGEYQVLKRDESPVGGRRELTFQCGR